MVVCGCPTSRWLRSCVSKRYGHYKLDILVYKLTIGVVSHLATYKAMFLHSALILGSIAVIQFCVCVFFFCPICHSLAIVHCLYDFVMATVN